MISVNVFGLDKVSYRVVNVCMRYVLDNDGLLVEKSVDRGLIYQHDIDLTLVCVSVSKCLMRYERNEGMTFFAS